MTLPQVQMIDPTAAQAVANEHAALAVFFTLSALPQSEVGARIRAIRKQAGLSQDALAKKASQFLNGEARLSQVDISRLEKAPAKAYFPTVVAVCKALSCTISDLLEEIPELVDVEEV